MPARTWSTPDSTGARTLSAAPTAAMVPIAQMSNRPPATATARLRSHRGAVLKKETTSGIRATHAKPDAEPVHRKFGKFSAACPIRAPVIADAIVQLGRSRRMTMVMNTALATAARAMNSAGISPNDSSRTMTELIKSAQPRAKLANQTNKTPSAAVKITSAPALPVGA